MSRILPPNKDLAKPGKRRKSHPGKSEKYLKQIRGLPCVLTGAPAEAAHVSYGDPARNKPGPSLSKKADDRWAVPLCPAMHRLANGCQHDCNEREWWEQWGVDPLALAEELWASRDDHAWMCLVVIKHAPTDPEICRKIVDLLAR